MQKETKRIKRFEKQRSSRCSGVCSVAMFFVLWHSPTKLKLEPISTLRICRREVAVLLEPAEGDDRPLPVVAVDPAPASRLARR